jgi:heme A synthase
VQSCSKQETAAQRETDAEVKLTNKYKQTPAEKRPVITRAVRFGQNSAKIACRPFAKGLFQMSKLATLLLPALLLLVSLAGSAMAYIGPGAGISVLGSLLGILTTILVAIAAIIFWPLRKFMKRRKARRNSLPDADTEKTVDRSTKEDV